MNYPLVKLFIKRNTDNLFLRMWLFFLQEILEKEDNRSINVLELGSGNGILSLMLAYYRNGFKLPELNSTAISGISEKNIEIIGKSAFF